MVTIDKQVSRLLIQLIKFYRAYLSPLIGSRCRFYPSCSAYAITALQQHGSYYGPYLIFRRLMRCHPFHQGGFDPVPEPPSKTHKNHGF